MTPFGQTSVRTTTIRHHTERGTATTAHNARLRWASGQWEVGQSMALGETSDLSMYVSHDDAARAGVQIRLNW